MFFGGVQTYEVYLVQQPLTFTFDLDAHRGDPSKLALNGPFDKLRERILRQARGTDPSTGSGTIGRSLNLSKGIGWSSTHSER